VPSHPLPAAERNRLLESARSALNCAYARYSNFRVAAAVLSDAGEIFTGVNVENASYGLTNCAERSAIFTAVRERKSSKLRLRAVAVVTGDDVPCSPCGACRQVISEFAEDCRVIFKGQDGYLDMSIQDLLPYSFRLS
jgi:cytidine deaminase